jgi:hypothetical protein
MSAAAIIQSDISRTNEIQRAISAGARFWAEAVLYPLRCELHTTWP